jgi:phosphatidylglycerophosphatase A
MKVPDPKCVVIDELVGMWLLASVPPLDSLLCRHAHYYTLSQRAMFAAVAFAAFRFFDVVKPPPLRRLERLPGGWGIMLDDLGACVYAWLAIQLIFRWIDPGYAVPPLSPPS